jgi:chemotaxis protein histidine kinase CheA
MATLGEYFETEARDRLAELDRRLRRPGEPDAAELYRHARALRGAAQIAREDRIQRAARVFEAALNAASSGSLAWTDAVAADARASVEDLQVLLERKGDDDQLDARVAQVIQRWSSAGLPLPGQVTGAYGAVGAETGATREFREFAAREVEAIADALDVALQQLAESPMDREPLRTILQRQRALLGARRLDELPVVAEILRAVEDLSGVIARLDIAVKREWLDVFRVARDGLRSAVGPLQQEQDPPATHALSRLRHIREELLDRYSPRVADPPLSLAGRTGTMPFEFATEPADTPAAAGPSVREQTAAPVVEAVAEQLLELDVEAVVEPVLDPGVEAVVEPVLDLGVEAAAEPGLEAGNDVVLAPGPESIVEAAAPAIDADGVVSIDDLVYSPDAALRRALQLRETVLDAQPLDPRAREAASEVFDLIRMALG